MDDKIREILSRYSEVRSDEIKDESRIIGDLGLDSMDLVDLVIDLEDTFSVEVSDRDLWNIQTFGDMKKYIALRVQQN